MPTRSKKNCPECGTPVRLDRIEEHYRKVHPKANRSGLLTEDEKEEICEKERASRRSPSPKRTHLVAFAVLGLIIVIVLLLVFYYPLGSQTGGTAPNFTLNDTVGNTVRLSDLKGKVVLLSMIDPKGNPCKVETQTNILSLFKNYGSRVEFMTIDVQLVGSDTMTALTDFKAQVGASWRFLLDDGSVKNGYGVDSTPRVYIIDRAGNIFYQHVGMSQVSDLSAKLDKALG